MNADMFLPDVFRSTCFSLHVDLFQFSVSNQAVVPFCFITSPARVLSPFEKAFNSLGKFSLKTPPVSLRSYVKGKKCFKKTSRSGR